ncbi:MAG TPA: glycosyltransferase [Sphingomonas sp.]|nr:glycosyltransferase [Sphingomonas sp.]
MKILRIIASIDRAYGGPAEGILRTGQVLQTMGIGQEIATLDAPGSPCLADIAATVHPLGEPDGPLAAPDDRKPEGRLPNPARRYFYAPRAVPWLEAHIGDYDAVIVSGLWNYATMAARRALVGGRVPYVVFAHGMLDPWFRRAYPLKGLVKQMSWLVNEGPLLNNATAVLFTSEEERVQAHRVFRPYRLKERVVRYGTADVAGDAAAQIAAFREAAPALGERRFLLFLGRIHQKKGCDLLIDAFANQAGRDPGLDLVIAGPDHVGWRPALEERARRLGVSDRIHWPGMLSGDRKWGAFRACEAMILPSHQENFGIVVAEAMACEKPVLVSDKVNIWREVAGAGAGLVAPDDAAGAEALIAGFLDLTPDERKDMAKRARACFLDRFEVQGAARDLAAVLTEAVEGHVSGGAGQLTECRRRSVDQR